MKAITDFINGEVTYDNEGQFFWINTANNGLQMLATLRGWGHIQHMFEDKNGKYVDMKKAAIYQDAIGQFVAEAINEKIKRLTQTNPL